MTDNSTSPVGWYIATYQLRFVEVGHDIAPPLTRRFLTWENSILVSAPSIENAFDKAVEFAQKETRPYKGGAEGIDVQWEFEGIVALVPVYEELADGSELFWTKGTRSLGTIRGRAMSKQDVLRALAK